MFKKIKDKIKAFLIEKMGKERYCKEFHEAFGDKNDETKWYCSKCDISYNKRLSDNYTGPR
jgi:hypothetical protein